MSGGNLQRLKECLVELRLPTFREHHGSQAALATKESWSYPQYLLALSELEVADRRERRIQKLRRTSKLPWDKSLTSLDRSRLPQSVDRQLSGLVEGDFLVQVAAERDCIAPVVLETGMIQVQEIVQARVIA